MHLDDDRLIDLLRSDAGADDDRRHVAACATCHDALEWWRHQLDGMRALAAESVTEGELHQLRALYRQRGPHPGGAVTRWLAHLVRSTGELVPALRGAAEPRMYEFEGGPMRVVLQLIGSTVHGQLLTEPDDVAGGTMVLNADDGPAYATELDELGEFHLEGIRPGRYHASWWTDRGRLDVADIEVEDASGD